MDRGRSMLEIFDWMSAIDNFILLSARYFCIPVSIGEVCSGTQVSYLEIV